MAFLAIATASPVGAQSASLAEMEQEIRDSHAWLQRVNDAVEVSSDGVSKIQQLQGILNGLGTSQEKVHPSTLHDLIAGARRDFSRSDAMLAAIPPPDPKLGLKPGFVTDAKSQNASFATLLNTMEEMIRALESRDEEKVRGTAIKLMAGSFLIFENQAMLERNRRSYSKPTEPNHQLFGITEQLYRAFGVVGRAWFTARFESKPDEGVLKLRDGLLSVSREVELLTTSGRANLAREIALIEREARRIPANDPLQAYARKLRQMLAEQEKIFVLGDDLARWAQGQADISPQALTALDPNRMWDGLVPLEDRLASTRRTLKQLSAEVQNQAAN